MQLRQAANIGRALVVVHLVMQTCLCAFTITRMLPGIRRNGYPTWFITILLYFGSSMILDIGLLIVLSCLARAREQLMRDVEDLLCSRH